MSKRTPLYETHLKYNGRIVDFAGYELPVQYDKGIIYEHNAVRNGVGLFDVSHMGEITLKGKDAAETVLRLVSNNLNGLENGGVRYALLTNEKGGVKDDILIYKKSDTDYLLVVNASNSDKDAEWIKNHLYGDTKFENVSDKLSQIAVQGPLSLPLIKKILPEDKIPVKYYRFIDNVDIKGANCLISRTGYTGEYGFEIYMENQYAPFIYELLMKEGAEFNVTPCGLGSRDTLRLEAGMPLYGHELREEYSANEAGLDMFIKFDHEFTGKDEILNNKPKFKRIGLSLIDKGIAREGSEIYDGNVKIGYISSGTHSPTLNHAIAMARVDYNFNNDKVYIDVRGRRLLASVTPLPFYKRSK